MWGYPVLEFFLTVQPPVIVVASSWWFCCLYCCWSGGAMGKNYSEDQPAQGPCLMEASRPLAAPCPAGWLRNHKPSSGTKALVAPLSNWRGINLQSHSHHPVIRLSREHITWPQRRAARRNAQAGRIGRPRIPLTRSQPYRVQKISRHIENWNPQYVGTSWALAGPNLWDSRQRELQALLQLHCLPEDSGQKDKENKIATSKKMENRFPKAWINHVSIFIGVTMICFAWNLKDWYPDWNGTSNESSANPAWSKTELPPSANAPSTLPSWRPKAIEGKKWFGVHQQPMRLMLTWKSKSTQVDWAPKKGMWLHGNKGK